MSQIVYYHPGVGTESFIVAKALGGLLGIGVRQDIVESYRFICDNYNFNDEIILLGFSRGAFVARSVAAMVCSVGFLNRPGLDQLPHIMKDYETWHRWHKIPYNPKMHLVGITLENLKRLRKFDAAKKRSQPEATPEKPCGPEAKLLYDLISRDVECDECLARGLCEYRKAVYEHIGNAHVERRASNYRDVLRDVCPPSPSRLVAPFAPWSTTNHAHSYAVSIVALQTRGASGTGDSRQDWRQEV
jgi:hypothetical protein